MPVAGNYFIQTSVDKQVNLVNADGLTLNYWDGDAGPKNNGVIDGGSGTWRSAARGPATTGPTPPVRSARPGARAHSPYSRDRAAT